MSPKSGCVDGFFGDCASVRFIAVGEFDQLTNVWFCLKKFFDGVNVSGVASGEELRCYFCVMCEFE